jgi:preprotein translocase subunit Sec61beta
VLLVHKDRKRPRKAKQLLRAGVTRFYARKLYSKEGKSSPLLVVRAGLLVFRLLLTMANEG